MIITNLRLEIDQLTFEPLVVVDCKISLDVLQQIAAYTGDIQDELYVALGKELVNQIQELRTNK